MLFFEACVHFFATKNIPQQLPFVLHKLVDRHKFVYDFFIFEGFMFNDFFVALSTFLFPIWHISLFLGRRFILFMKRGGFLEIPFCTDITTDLDSEKIVDLLNWFLKCFLVINLLLGFLKCRSKIYFVFFSWIWCCLIWLYTLLYLYF